MAPLTCQPVVHQTTLTNITQHELRKHQTRAHHHRHPHRSLVRPRIHTDAIQSHLIPPQVTPKQAAITYACEADLLNVALFGRTSSQWRDANPEKDGNMRDHATLEQLLVLANPENMNAEFIHMGLPQADRLKRINAIAIRQMQTLAARNVRQLKGGGA